MKVNLLRFTRWISCGILLSAVIFSGCSKDKDDGPDAIEELKIEGDAIHFGSSDGTAQSFAIVTDLSWEITFSSGQNDWYVLSMNSGTGNATVNVTALNNTGAMRSAILRVSAGSLTEYVEISQDGALVEEEANLLLAVNFGTGAGKEAPFPTLKSYRADLGISGPSAATASLLGENVDLRETSQSSGYPNSSAGNRIFFGKDGVLTIDGITAFDARSLQCSFGVYRYQQAGNSDQFSTDYLTVSLSFNGGEFEPVQYEFTRYNTGWNLAYLNADFPEEAEGSTMSLRFEAHEDSTIGVDDIKITVNGDLPQTLYIATANVTDIGLNSATLQGVFTLPEGEQVERAGFRYASHSPGLWAFMPPTTVFVDPPVMSPFSYVAVGLTDGADYYYTAFIEIDGVRYETSTANPGTFKTTEQIPISRIATNIDPGEIEDDFLIVGMIVTDGANGNYPSGMMAISDYTYENSGIALIVEGEHTYKSGDQLSILLQGAVVAVQNGLKTITVAADRITLTSQNNAVVPVRISAAELEKYVSMYVEIENAQSAEQGGTIAGNHRFTAYPGGSFQVFTQASADFAGQEKPAGNGSIRGVVSRPDENQAALYPQSTDDLASLTGERMGALTFDQILFNGRLSAGREISGASLEIPYDNGSGETYHVSASVGGVSGITVISQEVTLNFGAGTILLPVEGTPQSAGTALFTVSGIESLEENSLAVEVVEGGTVVYACTWPLANGTGAEADIPLGATRYADKQGYILADGTIVDVAGVTATNIRGMYYNQTNKYIYANGLYTAVNPRIRYVIPVNERLYGNLEWEIEVGGMDGTYKYWDVQYSTDGDNWVDIERIELTSTDPNNPNFIAVNFILPESSVIPAGGSLNFRLTPDRTGGGINEDDHVDASQFRFFKGTTLVRY